MFDLTSGGDGAPPPPTNRGGRQGTFSTWSGGGYPPCPPKPDMGHGGWGAHGGGGHPSVPPQVTGLGDLGLSNATVHAFKAVLQGVVDTGVRVYLTYPPPPTIPAGRITSLSLLYL